MRRNKEIMRLILEHYANINAESIAGDPVSELRFEETFVSLKHGYHNVEVAYNYQLLKDEGCFTFFPVPEYYWPENFESFEHEALSSRGNDLLESLQEGR